MVCLCEKAKIYVLVSLHRVFAHLLLDVFDSDAGLSCFEVEVGRVVDSGAAGVSFRVDVGLDLGVADRVVSVEGNLLLFKVVLEIN